MRITISSIKVNNIIKSAKEANISARKLCISAGLSLETIRRWRKGVQEPGAEKLNRLEQAFIYLTSDVKK